MIAASRSVQRNGTGAILGRGQPGLSNRPEGGGRVRCEVQGGWARPCRVGQLHPRAVIRHQEDLDVVWPRTQRTRLELHRPRPRGEPIERPGDGADRAVDGHRQRRRGRTPFPVEQAALEPEREHRPGEVYVPQHLRVPEQHLRWSARRAIGLRRRQPEQRAWRTGGHRRGTSVEEHPASRDGLRPCAGERVGLDVHLTGGAHVADHLASRTADVIDDSGSIHGRPEMHVEPVRERRQDVDRLHVAVVDASAALAGFLDEQRHARDVGHGEPVETPEWVSGPEARAVVGGDHDERAVEQPLRGEPVHQALDEGVRILHLQQVALIGLDDRPLLRYPPVQASQPRQGGVVRELLARAHVDEGLVRQQRMQVVQGRLGIRPADRVDEAQGRLPPVGTLVRGPTGGASAARRGSPSSCPRARAGRPGGRAARRRAGRPPSYRGSSPRDARPEVRPRWGRAAPGRAA